MHGQPDSRIYNIMTIRNIDAKFKEVSSFLGNRYQKSASVKLRIAPMYIYTIFSWQHYHHSLWFLFHPNVPEKTFWGATVTSVTGKHHNEVDDKNSSMQFINVTEKKHTDRNKKSKQEAGYVADMSTYSQTSQLADSKVKSLTS